MSRRPLNLIGPQLRRLRFERGLSQPELAEECQRAGWDVSRDTIANIEGARRWVLDFELILLSRVLQVPLEAFLPQPLNVTKGLKALITKPRRSVKESSLDVLTSKKNSTSI